jgi:hypothetical protein
MFLVAPQGLLPFALRSPGPVAQDWIDEFGRGLRKLGDFRDCQQTRLNGAGMNDFPPIRAQRFEHARREQVVIEFLGTRAQSLYSLATLQIGRHFGGEALHLSDGFRFERSGFPRCLVCFGLCECLRRLAELGARLGERFHGV